MNQPSSSHYFLTRLAMDAPDDPLKVEPLSKLRSIFEFALVHELLEELHMVCACAMSDGYTWKQGSPGNCLHYFAQLELLTECCYLINNGALKKTSKGRKKHPIPQKVPVKMLPIPLTPDEFRNPLQVIESFFQHAPLQEWKRQLMLWSENSLSRSSIIDEVEPEMMFPFVQHLCKLIYAAYLLCEYAVPEQKPKDTDSKK